MTKVYSKQRSLARALITGVSSNDNICLSRIHPTHSSCYLYGLLLFKDGIKQSYKIYFPLYLLSSLLYLRKRRDATAATLVMKLFESTIRSCFFISAHGSLLSVLMCSFSKLCPATTTQQTIAVVSAFGSGFVASLFEKPERIRELMIYCAGLLVEILWHNLSSRGMVCSFSSGSDFIFASSFTLLVYCYFRAGSSVFLPTTARILMQFLLGSTDILESSTKKYTNDMNSSVLGYALLGSMKVFLVGFSCAQSYKLLSLMVSAVKKGATPTLFYEFFFCSSAVKTSFLIGVFIGFIRVCSKYFSKISSQTISTLLISTVFAKYLSPSSEISLYLAGKSVETLACTFGYLSPVENSTGQENSITRLYIPTNFRAYRLQLYYNIIS